MGTYITKHPTVDFITSRSGPISKKIIDKLLLWSFNEFYLNNVKFIKPGSCGAFICVKKKSFDKVNGFDESIVFAEDFELASRMFKLGYKYSFLRRPKFWFSVRRMDKMGRVPYALELLKNSLYMHLKGNIKDKNIINYDMETEH